MKKMENSYFIDYLCKLREHVNMIPISDFDYSGGSYLATTQFTLLDPHNSGPTN